MAPYAITSTSDEHKAISQQQHLSQPHKIPHSHRVTNHAVDLSGEINGYTATDVPYTNPRADPASSA